MIFLEITVVKGKDGVLLKGRIPDEISNSSSLEIFPLRDGAYLLMAKGAAERIAGRAGAASQGQKAWALSEKEKGVVRKLIAIKFENRIPSEVNRMLPQDEQEILESLIKKNVVQIFQGGKYKKGGVYSVSDFAFNQAREAPAQEEKKAPPPPASSPEHLDKFGWMVLECEADARKFANEFPKMVKSGEVRGVRAFDRKFYFVKKQFAEKWEKKIQLSLGKSEKTAEEIAGEIGLHVEGCRALILHLCEGGEVLEKQKGKFASA